MAFGLRRVHKLVEILAALVDRSSAVPRREVEEDWVR
jgi:hypothetical protein